MRKIINHHIEGGTRESHPCVQDLKHPRLSKPRRGLRILDTRMGFPRPSLNVLLVSINLILYPEFHARLALHLCQRLGCHWLIRLVKIWIFSIRKCRFWMEFPLTSRDRSHVLNIAPSKIDRLLHLGFSIMWTIPRDSSVFICN